MTTADISLRDFFAGLAMAGKIANSNTNPRDTATRALHD